MTCQWMSRSRTFAASRTQRLVSQAHGHRGSNQKSTRAVTGALCTASVMLGAPRVHGPQRGPVVLLSAGKPSRAWVVPARRNVVVREVSGCPRARGKLIRVSVPNLTRDEATARAELLAVASYDLQLDVTDGAGHAGATTFRSTTTVEFSCRRPGT